MPKGFQPGNTFSRGKGRPRGSKSKGDTIQERLTEFLLGNVGDLQNEYDRDMSTGQKIRLFEVLLPFASPKLAANTNSNFEKYDKEQLTVIAEQLKNKIIAARKTISIQPNGQEKQD